MTSTLIAHCGTTKISRDELRTIPAPPATVHKPNPHCEVVQALIETLGFRHIHVVRDEYAVSSDGMKMFGALDLDYEYSDTRFSIGLRNANDKSMRLALTIGYHWRPVKSRRESIGLDCASCSVLCRMLGSPAKWALSQTVSG